MGFWVGGSTCCIVLLSKVKFRVLAVALTVVTHDLLVWTLSVEVVPFEFELERDSDRR